MVERWCLDAARGSLGVMAGRIAILYHSLDVLTFAPRTHRVSASRRSRGSRAPARTDGRTVGAVGACASVAWPRVGSFLRLAQRCSARCAHAAVERGHAPSARSSQCAVFQRHLQPTAALPAPASASAVRGSPKAMARTTSCRASSPSSR